MVSYFFPCTTLLPEFEQETISAGPFSCHRRKWQTTVFDLATLQANHKLHLSMHVMEIFLNHSNLEIEVRCDGREPAQEMARLFQSMLYLQGVSAFLTPFYTTHSYNDYSGINSRDSLFDSHREALSPGMRGGITSKTATIEAWLHDPSLWCMHSGGAVKVTEKTFLAAAHDFERWIKLEQVRAVEAALPSLAGSWSLERHESCKGSLSLLLMPANSDDMAAHFTVDQEAAELNLGVLRGDAFTPCGRYDSIEALIAALRHLASAETASMLDARRHS